MLLMEMLRLCLLEYRIAEKFRGGNFRDFREWLSNHENFVHKKKKKNHGFLVVI